MRGKMKTAILYIFSLSTFILCALALPLDDFKDDIEDNFLLNEFPINKHLEPTNLIEHDDLRRLNTSSNVCNNFYDNVCGEWPGKDTKAPHPREVYLHLRNSLIDILNSTTSEGELKSLTTEKILFQKCMNLGSKEDSIIKNQTMNYFTNLLKSVFAVRRSWQDYDMHLNFIGFGHMLFDINVESDPENPTKNIISIQPPSYGKIKILDAYLKEAFSSEIHYRKIAKFFDWYNYVTYEQDSIFTFLNEWQKIFHQTLSNKKNDKFEAIKMSLGKWNNLYNHGADRETRFINKVDWSQVVKTNFNKVRMTIYDDEIILIKNKNYFLKLSDILALTPNDVLVSILKTKFIFENLRYIDWRSADALLHKKRSTFCFEDTKLYGASFKLLTDLRKENSTNISNLKIIEKILENIADVTISSINVSKGLSSSEKSYMKSQVEWIASYINDFYRFRIAVSNYYGDYEVSSSYFESIVNYKNMLQEKNFKSLRYDLTYLTTEDITPFSITDLQYPRNRFIVNLYANTFLISKTPNTHEFQKEFHYSIYGVTLTSFLYALLNENRFQDGTLNIDNTNWSTHPKYSVKAMKCFLPKDLQVHNKHKEIEPVSETIGLRIAYKAMLKDYHHSTEKRPEKYITKSNYGGEYEITADQLFFTSYAKSHCHLGRTVLNNVLSNVAAFSHAFGCYGADNGLGPKCHMRAFGRAQDKSHFVIAE